MAGVPDEYVDRRLRFWRAPRGDRFAHGIDLCIDGQYRRALESVEPSADEAWHDCWPPSPPLQDWHFNERGDVSIFMAVGAAGKTHWSMAIEIVRDRRITFEVAARIVEDPAFLGSRYRPAGDARTIGSGTIQLLPGIQLGGDATTFEVEVWTGDILIQPAATRQPGPQTVSWRYWL